MILHHRSINNPHLPQGPHFEDDIFSSPKMRRCELEYAQGRTTRGGERDVPYTPFTNSNMEGIANMEGTAKL